MNEGQFISHAQVAPPKLVPRAGLGIFSALGLVVAVLAGAITAGLVLVDQSMQGRLEAGRARLLKLRQEIEVESVYEAESIEKRIKSGQQLLDNHIYASQAFNFYETYTLAPVRLNTFSYGDSKIKMEMTVPSYTAFAQQIKYYRSLGDQIVKEFTFQPPKLTDTGDVAFSVEVTLARKFLNSKPNRSAAPAAVEPTEPEENES